MSMLNIDKKELNNKYNSGDMSYFFKDAEKITSYLIVNKFFVKDQDEQQDMIQECLLNLWKKVEQGKVDGSKNLMSFIWQNSKFRVLEILRKQRNRDRIAKFISLDAQDYDQLELESVIKKMEVEYEKL